MNQPLIHPTAVVDPDARLGVGVHVGAYAIVGPGVVVGDRTEIRHHAVVDRLTELGADCVVYPFCSIGTDPQDITYQGEDTRVRIGDRNKIREFVTVNRGTLKGGGLTALGDDNYLMAYAHVAHDCQIGNKCILINGATLAGHVEVEDSAVIGAHSSVHQFVRIGRNAYIGGYSVILQDILPFSKVAQARRSGYQFYGPNAIGMMRNGYERDYIEHVKDIFDIIYRSDLNTTQALESIQERFPQKEESRVIEEFIQKSRRGILKHFNAGEA